MKIVTVIAAGGTGTRMNAGINKLLIPIRGKTVIRRSIEAFRGLTDEMMIAACPADLEEIRQEAERAEADFPIAVVPGGQTRQESILLALKSAAFGEDDLVLVHDGARCFVEADVIRRVIDACLEKGSGVPGIPVTSTIKMTDASLRVTRTLPRDQLMEIQTPQGFPARALLKASMEAAEKGYAVTDDASVMEKCGYPVQIVEGSARNIKLTRPEDLGHVKGEMTMPSFRVGTGYDVHVLTEGRKLILCGVDIPWEKGLLGNSDADVALHALMDAMLGAAALGDIGKHFPDTDERYRGISSILLLQKTAELLREHGWEVSNADVTIVAQKPKLLPHIPQMRKNTADAIGCDIGRISIKATTTEHLGFEGRGEGISAQAVCMISRDD